jgi:fatty acid desaturase
MGLALLGIYLPLFLPLPPWLRPAWITAAAVLCFRAHVVIHNHIHFRIFRRELANSVFHVAAALARGHTVCDTLLPHIHNHHPLRGRQGDWVSPDLAGEAQGPWRILRYILVSTYTMQRERRRPGVSELTVLPRSYRRSRPFEKSLLGFAILLSLAWDWRMFLLHQALPWMLSLAMLVAINLFQHDGCDPESDSGHSRNFRGRWLNAFCFNNGYHTLHHDHPRMHWSDLPAACAREGDRIPARCNEPSFPRYLWRNFLRPARRARVPLREA